MAERQDTRHPDTRHPDRPSPDALLAAANAGARGRLKVFLGMAPGVGKTYEMLTAARARRAEGVDVVIGVVETHGRRETLALVEGLEAVPRRRVEYRGRTLDEMDLDAVLARRPALVLVDELAHTNAPGSRHPKRYLDVAELIEAGIDVYTTLNIQHLESLSDVVAGITRVRVSETVPDGVLDGADDVEVIDLTPADLIQRLRDGKVYVPDTAGRALENYFSPGNLTALRELALRRTAQRVDEQLLTHMQQHAIQGPWGAGERVMVCVGSGPGGQELVRYGRRMAERLHAPWTALHVETSASARLGQAARDRVAETLRGAERLGAESMVLPGRSVAEEALRQARAGNVTHIVVGRESRSRWAELLTGSITRDLLRGAGSISVHVIACRGDAAAGRAPAVPDGAWPGLGLRDAALTGLVMAASTGIGLALQRLLDVHNVALVLLTGVLGCAVLFGLGPALLACGLGVLAFNFFFLSPLYTFTITDPENVVTLVVFLIVAVIASNLTASVRAQAVVARRRAKTTEDLYLFSRKLAGVGPLDDVLWAAAFQMASMLRVSVVLLLPERTQDGSPQPGAPAIASAGAPTGRRGALEVRAGYPPEDRLDGADLAAAHWAFENNRAAGRGADTLPGGRRLFLPLWTARGAVGVVGLDREGPADAGRPGSGPLLSPEERRLIDALLDQTALAIERVLLMESLDRARLVGETDRLRTALLTSISHDLRTPLASILGAAGTLADMPALLGEPEKRELASTIREEAERLNRFIVNLLDMTRLESGAVRPNAGPHDLGEIVGSALRRARTLLAGHRVEVDLAPSLPMLELDPVLFEQVLFNLIDNAAKYTPAGSTVRVQAVRDGARVSVQVLDDGPGLDPADLERIFDKFARARLGDEVRPGTGLGLAVCRGFVEAMGGTVTAGNRSDGRGAVFTIVLPVPVSEQTPGRAGRAVAA